MHSSYLAEEIVTNPVQVDKNTVTGSLPSGHEITLHRYLDGFSANLRITVRTLGGEAVQVHDMVAGDAERHAFRALSERALLEQDNHFNARKKAALKATRDFFAKY